jgi:hypothetical protein
MAMSFEEDWRRARRRRLTALAPLAAFLLWIADNHYHNLAALRALEAAGHGERTIAPSRRWRCTFGRGSEFWAQGGRKRRETTGFVCTSHVRPARIHYTEDIDFNPFQHI